MNTLFWSTGVVYVSGTSIVSSLNNLSAKKFFTSIRQSIYRNLKLLSFFYLMFALTACGGGSKGDAAGTPDASVPPTTTPPVVSPSSRYYNLQVGCPSYFGAINSPSWFSSYGDQSKVPLVYITELDGTLISQLNQNRSSLGYAEFISQDISSEIEKYPSKYLTFRCIYQQRGSAQKFEYRHPISDDSIWQKSAIDTNRTTTYFEVSMISDLQMRIWQALMKSGYLDANAWAISQKTVTDAFGEVEFGALKHAALQNCCGLAFYTEQQRLVAEAQPNGRAFRKLKLLAELNTSEPSGDIQAIIATAVSDWVNYTVDRTALSQPKVTGAIFRQLTKPLSKDAMNFGTSAWKQFQSSDPAFSSTAKTNIDGSWQASLDWVSGTANAEYSVQRYQSVSLPADRDYSKLFVDFSLLRAVGGCQPAIFGCTIASGIAGIFVCYQTNTGATVGCTVFTAVSDLITVPTYLGGVFTAANPFGRQQFDIISISPNSPNSDTYGLDRTYALSSLFEASVSPSIREAGLNRSISRLEFGAVVLTSSNSCYKCRAEISIRRLGMQSL
ncbi:hypothetical protein EOE67_13595 [Rheinheimera riviphila]|uniref:Uncharacterized protein n=1 Tax=Rheinheimera riviphila TaxID=1834037 RepID=A0A437QMB2_9GAMM|nr:hypothetical protein [Rheinheimera riviphila]RVU35622.1 hypothetical protein EOE67_13595 [Rheinheimera riviphila]